jgi:two-component system cell cycle response regulator
MREVPAVRGNAAVPWAVLQKQEPLDEPELELLRRHPTVGANILGVAPALAGVAEIVRSSHERYDGLGYPLGLSGDAIPLASRILAASDAFDAMLSDRSYSPSISEEGALEELRRTAGSQFDPVVVAAFVAALRERRASARPGSRAAPVLRRG